MPVLSEKFSKACCSNLAEEKLKRSSDFNLTPTFCTCGRNAFFPVAPFNIESFVFISREAEILCVCRREDGWSEERAVSAAGSGASSRGVHGVRGVPLPLHQDGAGRGGETSRGNDQDPRETDQ